MRLTIIPNVQAVRTILRMAVRKRRKIFCLVAVGLQMMLIRLTKGQDVPTYLHRP